MIFHHFVSIAWISSSYIEGFVNAAIFVLFVHDMNDVPLNFAKIAYMVRSNNENVAEITKRVNMGFVFFGGILWYILFIIGL